MSDEKWQLWGNPRGGMRDSRLLRYGIAVLLPCAAAVIVHLREVFAGAPFFIFLGAVVLSAANGGLAPAFLATALSSLLIRLLFVGPSGAIYFQGDAEGMELMVGFVMVALLASSFVASLRRDRNHVCDSEERYRLLAETASDAIIVIDERGEILYANPVSEKIFGGSSGPLPGRNLNSLLPGENYRATLSDLQHRLDTRKRSVTMRLPGLHCSGENLLIEMTLGTSRHRGRNMFTAVLRDVTEHER